MLNKEKIKKINWYKQAASTVPLTVSMPALGLNKPMYQKSGFYLPYDIFILIKEDGQFMFYHYFDYDLCNKQMDRVFKILDKQDNLFDILKKDFYQSIKDIQLVGKKIISTDIDDTNFKKFYKDFIKYCTQFWANTIFLDMMDPFGDKIIDFIFGKKRKQINKQQLNILFSPDKKSNLQKEQEDFLKIYHGVKVSGIDNNIKKLLFNHSKAYHWLNSNFQEIKYLDADYFEKVLIEWLEDNGRAESTKKSLDKFNKNLTAKKKIIKELELDKEIVRKLYFFNSLTNLRDDRKKFQLISNHFLLDIVNKISKKYNIAIKDLVKLVISELGELLSGNIKILDKLKNRDRDGLVFTAPTKNDYIQIIEKVKAKEYFEIIENSMVASEIKGMTAFGGKVVGTVKIVNKNEDFVKIEEGDVLVTAMTRPEFLPIMKKAIAIVTDEGGITCHAAIVSRELGIPCIIGSQVATKILNDGDLVFVNADHGLVKIIKKYEKDGLEDV